MHMCRNACKHTQQGETGSPLTLHDWSLFPSLSLPAEIVLTKEREREEGEGWRGWGRGCMCCSVVTGRARERGGGRRELEGERGSVGEKDRVPVQPPHTHTRSHMYMSAALLYFVE